MDLRVGLLSCCFDDIRNAFDRESLCLFFGAVWWPRTAIRNFLDNSRKFNFCNQLILKLLHFFFYKENIKDVFCIF